jgi:phage terminase large subunit GpA-like protein
MAVAYTRARPLPETFKTWVNTALGETFEESSEKLETGPLADRRESYTSESVPPGILLLTAGTDVQDDRLETIIYGWGEGEECWRVEHIVLRGDPGGQALWAEHDAILKRKFRTDDGRSLLIESCCIDSGGHYTDQVYRYCLKRKRFRVWAIKGQAGPGKLGWPKKASKGKSVAVALWLIGVDTIKSVIYDRLRKITVAGPGYFHFDESVDTEYFEQLTSEVVVTRLSQGRRIRSWKPKKLGSRQEALDCTVYAYAAMLGRGGSELLTARAKSASLSQVEDKQPTPVDSMPTEEAPTFDAPKPELPPVRRVNRFRGRNWTRNWK